MQKDFLSKSVLKKTKNKKQNLDSQKKLRTENNAPNFLSHVITYVDS